MPRPHTDNPAVRYSFSIRLEHVRKIQQLMEWTGENKSNVAQMAIECLYAAESAKRTTPPGGLTC